MLMFPKPMREEKKKRRPLRPRRVGRLTVRGGGDLPLGKPVTVRDEALLREMRGWPCLICGKRATTAHHIIPRSYQRLDVPENLVPLCWDHHRLAEDGDPLVERAILEAKRDDLARIQPLAPLAWPYRLKEGDGPERLGR